MGCDLCYPWLELHIETIICSDTWFTLDFNVTVNYFYYVRF
jgi:hypothetical protein